jgi:hypothetical protein
MARVCVPVWVQVQMQGLGCWCLWTAHVGGGGRRERRPKRQRKNDMCGSERSAGGGVRRSVQRRRVGPRSGSARSACKCEHAGPV